MNTFGDYFPYEIKKQTNDEQFPSELMLPYHWLEEWVFSDCKDCCFNKDSLVPFYLILIIKESKSKDLEIEIKVESRVSNFLYRENNPGRGVKIAIGARACNLIRLPRERFEAICWFHSIMTHSGKQRILFWLIDYFCFF